MTDPFETAARVADATKSVSNTARKGMEVTEKAAAFIARLLGKDAAGILQDRIFYYRAVNAVNLQDKLDPLLVQRHIANPNSIPLRLAIPFLDAATLEDDDTLQERWAHLLTSAMDPGFNDPLVRQYGEVLKVISPLDCLVLEAMARRALEIGKNEIIPGTIAAQFSISQEALLASMYRLKALGLVDDEHELPIGARRGDQRAWPDRTIRHVTSWGRMFLKTCSPTIDYIPFPKSGHDR